MKTGIFVESFNAFTVGHSIVRRALPLFDRMVIGVVGDQVHKPGMPSAEERIKAIADLYADEPRIEVKAYYGLAVDFARQEGARFIVKGVRSVKDFEYEREQADINRQIAVASRPSCSTASRSIAASAARWCANCSTSAWTSVRFCRNEDIN